MAFICFSSFITVVSTLNIFYACTGEAYDPILRFHDCSLALGGMKGSPQNLENVPCLPGTVLCCLHLQGLWSAFIPSLGAPCAGNFSGVSPFDRNRTTRIVTDLSSLVTCSGYFIYFHFNQETLFLIRRTVLLNKFLFEPHVLQMETFSVFTSKEKWFQMFWKTDSYCSFLIHRNLGF